MKSYNKAEVIVKKRRIMLMLGLVACILSAFIFFSNKATAENENEVYTYYTSYEIQPGDTLWSIADQYTSAENSDKEQFISNLKENNHMLDDEITAGNYLIIEYKSAEML